MISAKVIADTCHPAVPSARIVTIEYVAPRWLLAEINTHGLLAKSAASSRAIPVEKRIRMVEDNPFVPKAFGKNKPGMQAAENLDESDTQHACAVWEAAAEDALKAAYALSELGVHKQHANRVLEPYAYFTGVITATEWDNFFDLRLHPDAMPEFRELSALISVAMTTSMPTFNWAHLPYVIKGPDEAILPHDFRVSAARCARVSYKTHDGRSSSINEDIALCDKLIAGGHMSPFDHVATIDTISYVDGHIKTWCRPTEHGRFWGWIPYRNQVERDLGKVSRRSSFNPIP